MLRAVRSSRGLIGTRRLGAGSRVGVLIAIAAAALVAGCGGSGAHSSGEASKSPEAILKDASAALRRAHSFRATGRVALSGQNGTVSVGYEAPRSLTFDLTAPGGATAKLILIGAIAYLNANKAFYLKQGAAARPRRRCWPAAG